MKTAKIAILTLALILGACSDDGATGGQADAADVDSRSDIDASMAADAAAPDAMSPFGITGSIVKRHVTNAGEELAPEDLSVDLPVEVWTANPGGIFTAYSGVGYADGTFEFSGVPQGETYVRYGNVYFHTEQREFDFGIIDGGRSDVQPTTQATPIDLQLDGLEPWDAGYGLQLTASGANLWLPVPPQNAPFMVGETTVNSTMDYHQASIDELGAPSNLIASSQGDDLWLTQMVHQPIPGTAESSYDTVAKAINVAGFEQQDGQTSSIAGTLEDVPQDITLLIDWRGEEFASLATQMIPDTGTVDFLYSDITGYAVHNPLGTSAASASGDLLYVNFVPNDENVTFTATGGNPFPATWGQLAWNFWVSYSFIDDGDGGTTYAAAGYLEVDTLQDLFSGPVQPKMSPVRDLLIENLSTSVMQTGLPESPELTWTPPELGIAEFYEVRVLHLTADARTVAARVRTTGTAVRIPPGIMELGERYLIEVRAYSASNLPFTGPFGLRTEGIYAGHATHVMAR